MDVSFRSAALAALCSSESRLAERWGTEAGRAVGRRLCELSAADLGNLDRLPRAIVSRDGNGETIIDFGGEVTLRGQIGKDDRRGDYIVITAVEVQGIG